MDGGDSRNLERGQPIKNLLACRNKRAQLTRLRLPQKRLQIGPRDKDRLLRRGHDHTFERVIFFDRIDVFAQALHRLCIEDIRTRFRPVERQDADAVRVRLPLNH